MIIAMIVTMFSSCLQTVYILYKLLLLGIKTNSCLCFYGVNDIGSFWFV